MAEIKRTVTTTDENPIGQTATTQHTEQVSTTDNTATIVNAVRFIYGIVAILLALRFVLRLTAANPANAFVKFIYGVSHIFSMPFDTIFGMTATPARAVAQSVFEPSILVAIVIYGLVAWGITKLVTLNRA